MIHFSSGQSPLALPADNVGADLLRAVARVPNLTETPPAASGDTISVKSVHAALELGLMNHQDPNSLPAAGAADYQLARVAAVASEPATSMQHLEMAVHESPAYASVALQDPAFEAMRGPVQELVDRVTFVAGTSQSAPAGTYQPTRVVAPMPMPSGDAPALPEQPVMTGHAITTPQDPESTAAASNPIASAPRPSIQAPLDTASAASVPPVLSAPQASRSVAAPPQAPVPSAALQLPRAVAAALDLELLSSWDTGPARAAAGGEYQLALSAMQAGDGPAALAHLEQSILAHPAQAATALADPAFDAIKGSVRDMVTRLTAEVRLRADTSISEARLALQSADTSGMARPLLLARAYLDAAQASFQFGTYTGIVQAAFAADLAQRIASGKISPEIPSVKLSAFEPIKRAVQRAARRLWQRLPLLAILLGWLVAGICAGITSLAFQSGAELRAWLLPAWAMGLLAVVLVGFIRSIRRIAQRWN